MITFDGIDASTWGLILVSTEIEKPVPKTSFIEVPFSDGAVDLTEVSGEVKFSLRNAIFRFKTVGTSSLESVATTVANQIHGQKVKVILDKDPNYYYYGRASVEYSKDLLFGEVTITMLCEPYKYKIAETTESFRIGTNIMVNSRYAKQSGTITDWVAENATINSIFGFITITGNGSGASPAAYCPVDFIGGHLYYLKTSILPNSEGLLSASLLLGSTVEATLTNPTVGDEHMISAIVHMGVSATGNVKIKSTYADAATANGKSISARPTLLVDLTKVYGAGNEPTVEEFDAIVSEIQYAGHPAFFDYANLTDASLYVTLTNDRKKSYPKVTTPGATTIVKDGVTYSFGTVTDQQTTIPLTFGDNALACSGNGLITFEWQEGAL